MDLHVLLTAHLASDASAAAQLPEVLRILDGAGAALLAPGPHTQKWATRLSALLHAKDAGARWAGLHLCLRTAQLSRALLLERAQGWLALALPMLSKPHETRPNAAAAVRLVAVVLSAALDVPEFTRQLAAPAVPKFAAALLALAAPESADELAVLAMRTLAHLVPLYPAAHKSLHGALRALALAQTSGGAPAARRDAAAALFGVLPHLAGKAGAAAQWRKSVDETLAFGWEALRGLRSTFPIAGKAQAGAQSFAEDPMVAVPLAIDRLKCTAVVLRELLQFSTTRPVSFPVGALVDLAQTMLSCTTDGKVDGPVDSTRRALEESAVPSIWAAGSDILVNLARVAGGHLTPFVSRLLTVLSFQLERSTLSAHRTIFLRSTIAVLEHTHGLHHALLPTRLTKAVLALLTPLLRPQAEGAAPAAPAENGTTSTSRKGKKRAREYEGDEVFKVGGGVMLPHADDGAAVLLALDALQILMAGASVSAPTASLASRVVLALHLSLPSTPAAQLAPDLSLHTLILSKIADLAVASARGTSNVLGKALPLLLRTARPSAALEGMVHPRVPPLVRALPHVQALSLFRAEEGDEERRVRRGVGVAVAGELGEEVAGAVEAAAAPGALADAAEPTPVAVPVLAAPKPSAPIATPLLVAQANESAVAPPPASFGGVLAPSAATGSGVQNQAASTSWSMPPPPPPVATTSTAQLSSAPPVAPPVATSESFGYAPMQEDEDEDEPMPSIDVASDSDESEE